MNFADGIKASINLHITQYTLELARRLGFDEGIMNILQSL